MVKINNWLLVCSFFMLVISFFKRNEFPLSLEPNAQLHQDPFQSLSTQTAFSTTYNNESFDIIPQYDYELYGIVVSYRLHDSEAGLMIHALSKDHLNVADYCVVWGESANPLILREFDFSNAQFTCRYGTKDMNAWHALNHEQLSNNHLIAVDEAIRDQIDEIRIGDQIHIKGWLSHYKTPNGFERGTSITRTDTGNGACETIWVNEMTILTHMHSIWRKLMWLSSGLLILTLSIYFKAPYEPHKHH